METMGGLVAVPLEFTSGMLMKLLEHDFGELERQTGDTLSRLSVTYFLLKQANRRWRLKLKYFSDMLVSNCARPICSGSPPVEPTRVVSWGYSGG